jgi:iron complex transport system permease protein
MAGLAGLVLVSILSLRIGSLDVSTTDAWDALVKFNPDSYEQTAVRALGLHRSSHGRATNPAS